MAAYGRENYQLDIRDGILEAGTFEEQQLRRHHAVGRDRAPAAAAGDFENRAVLAQAGRRAAGKLSGHRNARGAHPGTALALLAERPPDLLHAQNHGRTVAARGVLDVVVRIVLARVCRLGYVAQRAAPYGKPLELLRRTIGALGIGKLWLTYNIGQTLAVARA